jgi:hypothetical protein
MEIDTRSRFYIKKIRRWDLNDKGITHSIQASGLLGIIMNLCREISHEPQLRVIGTKMDIEVLKVEWGALVPLRRMVCQIIPIIDDRRFAIL